MQLNEVYKIADELAPKAISDEACQKYGYYDNSGILVDTGEDVKGILFSLDLSDKAIDKALEVGANLIITHHPAIYGGIGERLTQDTPLGRKLCLCIKNGISIIAMHLNLDCAEDGIDESLMQGVMLSAAKTTGAGMDVTQKKPQESTAVAVMHPLSQGGYGRVYDVEETTLGALAEELKKTFSSQRIFFYGDRKRTISRAASFCGAGVDEGTLQFAKKQGADVMISADFKHHFITGALESGMAVIVLTHYASEEYGYKKYYEKIRRQIGIPCAYHTDEHLL